MCFAQSQYKGGGLRPPPFVVSFVLALSKAHVLALNTAHVLRLNKADVLALNKAHVLRLNMASFFGQVVFLGKIKNALPASNLMRKATTMKLPEM